MRAEDHPEQSARIAALQDLQILDTPIEREFDEIVQLASRICEAPISVINLIDTARQWFKAEVGLGTRETPLDTSICAHVILADDLTIVPDTLNDSRFSDNPLCTSEPNLRFYAGALLKTDDGLPIGTLCVLDTQPRTLSPLQQEALQVLARQVMARIVLRRELMRSQTIVREVDHRVKNSLSLIASMLSLQGKSAGTDEAREAIELARSRVMAVTRIHEQLHQSTSTDEVDLAKFLQRLADDLMSQTSDMVRIRTESEAIRLPARDSVNVGIAVNELVTNALRHGFDELAEGEISVGAQRRDGMIDIVVANNGRRLPAGFDPAKSRGLGMRVVSATARQKGGALTWSDDQDGVRFVFSFAQPQPELAV